MLFSRANFASRMKSQN